MYEKLILQEKYKRINKEKRKKRAGVRETLSVARQFVLTSTHSHNSPTSEVTGTSTA
jgi:hypothetical protein